MADRPFGPLLISRLRGEEEVYEDLEGIRNSANLIACHDLDVDERHHRSVKYGNWMRVISSSPPLVFSDGPGCSCRVDLLFALEIAVAHQVPAVIGIRSPEGAITRWPTRRS